MKKIIKSWGLVFSISVFVLVFLFFSYNYSNLLKPPAEGWSREIPIKSFTSSEIGTVELIRTVTLPVRAENKLITLWNNGNEIFYMYTDADGKSTSEQRLGKISSQPQIMNGVLDNGRITLYTIENGNLNRYIFDLNENKLISGSTLDNSVESFRLTGGTIVYSTGKDIRYADAVGKVNIMYDSYAKMMDVKQDADGTYNLAVYTRSSDGGYTIKYLSYNEESHYLAQYKIAEVPDIGMASLTIGTEKDNVAIFSVFRDSRVGMTTTTCYTFSRSKPSAIKSNLIDISGNDPNPVIVGINNNLVTFMAAVDTQRGLKDKDTNIAEIVLNNGKIESTRILTRTEEPSSNPVLYTMGKDRYLQWEDTTAVTKTIEMAGTGQNVIKAAGKIRSWEWSKVIMNTLQGEFFGLAFLLIVVIVIIVPTLVLMMLTMIFAMNWSERYPNRLANIAMSIQIIPKLFLAKWIVFDKPELKAILPVYLKNPASLILIIILAELSAVYCTKRKYPKSDIQNSFLIQYVFFALLDVILYGLIFLPYRSL